MTSVRCLVLAALALLVPCMSARAGTIRGSVLVPSTIRAPAPVPNPYPGRADALPQARVPLRGRVTDAVVYVARIPADAESALAKTPRPRPQLAQKDEAFLPRAVAVLRGGSVDFPNLDPIYHNVFSLSPTRRFDLGKYREGQSKAVVFNRAGVVMIFCDIHPDMEAFVLVVANRAFTQPGPDGAFELPDLPPGPYELRVWHPDLPEIVRPVQIPVSGDVRVQLRF